MADTLEWVFVECFWDVFLSGFCVSLVRPGVLIFLGLMLFTRFGAGLGLPLLFWRPAPMPKTADGHAGSGETHPHSRKQFFVGLGVGALVWQVVLSGYLFEELATNFTRDRPPFCEIRDFQFGEARFDVDSEPKFPGRFRYDPLGWWSVWLYAADVVVGFTVTAAVVGLAILAFRFGIDLLRKRQDWEPYTPDRSGRTDRQEAIPRSWIAMVAGLACGLLATWLLNLAWYSQPLRPVSNVVGWFALDRSAGWGQSAGRKERVGYIAKAMRDRQRKEAGRAEAGWQPSQEYWESIVEKSEQVKATALRRSEAKEWLAPYHAVFGAFCLNFVVVALVSLSLLCLPLRTGVFSPVVAILFLLNLFVAVVTAANYFSPVPAEFVYLLLFGLLLAAGRGYKLRFPHLDRYYNRPVRLDELYAFRAAAEANETHGPERPTVRSDPPALLDGVSSPVQQIWNTEVVYPHPSLLGPHKRAEGRKPPLAIVCVSGGGS